MRYLISRRRSFSRTIRCPVNSTVKVIYQCTHVAEEAEIRVLLGFLLDEVLGLREVPRVVGIGHPEVCGSRQDDVSDRHDKRALRTLSFANGEVFNQPPTNVVELPLVIENLCDELFEAPRRRDDRRIGLS